MTAKATLNPWETLDRGSSYRELIATRSTSDNEARCSIYEIRGEDGPYFEAWFTHKVYAGSIAGERRVFVQLDVAKAWCDNAIEEYLKDVESEGA